MENTQSNTNTVQNSKENYGNYMELPEEAKSKYTWEQGVTIVEGAYWLAKKTYKGYTKYLKKQKRTQSQYKQHKKMNMLKELLDKIIAGAVERLLEAIINAVERALKMDLNQDGEIGKKKT
jgi:isopenicillin N synthase-like dioxygenase